MKRGYPRARQSGGPLVTNHLHDLDMELELLKRKRLMIERQQQMLSNDRFDQQPYHRSQPQYDQRPSYGQSRNFSHVYDDGRQGGMNSQFGQNYQSVGPSWELSAPNQYVPQSTDNRGFSSNRNTFAPKPRNPNFSPKPRNPNFTPKNKDFNQHNYKINNNFNSSQQMGNGSFKNAQQFKPKFVPPSNRPNKTGPVKNLKKDFNPSKVTKPKNKASYNAPNKLSHQPVETRRALVEKAAPLSKEQNKELVLRADRRPKMKETGALGTIMKQIREQFAKYPEYFENYRYLREMKRELRLRVRKVLSGKVVPQLQEIVKMYRAEFPPETDKSFLDLCIAKDDREKYRKHAVQKFLYEDDPEKFFKFHFHSLFSSQMDKMFEKLIKIQQTDNDKQFDEMIADLPDLFAKPDANDETIEKSSTGDEEVESSVELSKDNEAAQNEPAKDESGQVETAQAESFQPDPASNESPEQTQQEKFISENEKEDKQEVDTPKDAAVENGNELKEEIPEATESVAKAKYVNDVEKIKFYRKLLEPLIAHRLPSYLLKKKEDIIKLFNFDTAYRFSRGAVLMEANKIAEKLNKQPPSLSLVDSERDDSQQTDGTPKKTYSVKVVGKPSLPDKKVMKVFIDTFNPKTIKKHKIVNNLLFISFSGPADMEKILSANGTTVGNKKLTITKSDKFHGSRKGDRNGDPNNTSADLENNISQLLSTIRNAEEENATVKEEAKVEDEENEEMTSENDENIENVIDEIVEAESENDAGLEISSIKEDTETRIDAEKAKETVADAEKEAKNEKVDAVKDVVPTGRATPTRTSARIGTATPSTVRTRRTSKLAQNN